MINRFFSAPLVWPFLLSAAIFAVSTYIGVLASQVNPQAVASSQLIRELEEVLAPLRLLNGPQIMLLIFLNNSIKALVVIILGYTVGLVPFIFLVINGLLIGLVVGSISVFSGPWAALPALAPHGVIELPALLLASGLGFRVALAVVRRLIGHDVRPGQELKNGLLIYAKFILPALFIAAIIETFVTPLVIGA